ncbi:MAG: hypothetical protein PHC86_00115 [Eubacteriales bacterium]|nr:hypothetical protein [Eubacteriales bacterium]
MHSKIRSKFLTSLVLVISLISLSVSNVFAIANILTVNDTLITEGETAVFTTADAYSTNHSALFIDGSFAGNGEAEDVPQISWLDIMEGSITSITVTFRIYDYPFNDELQVTWDDEFLDEVSTTFGFPAEDAPVERIPQKRDPITLTTGAKGNTHTNDLALFVAIPEQWMDTTSQVEFWLDSEAVTAKSIIGETIYAFINAAKANLKSVGSSLLATTQVDLMQRVTLKDGTTSEAKVAQEFIRGNFTIRLPIPANLLKTKNLGIVYIEDGTGLTANLASKIVIIDGVSYLEFENNRSAVYGFVSDKNNAAS